jgi:hypothetical protein
VRKLHCHFQREGQQGEDYLAVPEYSDDAAFVPQTAHRATVKFDGTGCLLHEGQLYARRRVKAGTPVPEGGPRTYGHGWIPVADTGGEHWRHREAYINLPDNPPDGTYELVGPGIRGNPYDLMVPTLIKHGVHIVETISVHGVSPIRAFQTIEVFLSEWWMEGIVFWSEDNEPIAKVTKRDFGFPWPSTDTMLPPLRGDKLVAP